MINVSYPADEPVILMSRLFDAPRNVVWKAFIDPKHVAEWYGGHGFSSPVCEMDVRPGGLWRHVMRTPSGSEYAMEYVFVEVVKPERLAWKSASYGKGPAPQGQLNVLTTVTLEEAGRKTQWHLVARFESMADRDAAKAHGFATILGEGSDKLDAIAIALTADTENK